MIRFRLVPLFRLSEVNGQSLDFASAQPPKWIRSFFCRLHKKKSGAGGLSRHPNQKEKARVEGTEASLGERERNLNGRRTGWSELVGVGRLVWPTGADTRRKHARRNVARFVASCTYRYTCTGHVHGGGLACTYARVSQGERTDAWWGRERRRRSDERKARTERELRTTSRNRPWRSHRDHLSRLSHLHTWVST